MQNKELSIYAVFLECNAFNANYIALYFKSHYLILLGTCIYYWKKQYGFHTLLWWIYERVTIYAPSPSTESLYSQTFVFTSDLLKEQIKYKIKDKMMY